MKTKHYNAKALTSMKKARTVIDTLIQSADWWIKSDPSQQLLSAIGLLKNALRNSVNDQIQEKLFKATDSSSSEKKSDKALEKIMTELDELVTFALKK